MSVAKEIREEQKQALSTMSPKQKLAYFWDYYKIHVLVAAVVIAVIISFVRQYLGNKDTAFYAVLLNVGVTDSNAEIATSLSEDFREYAGIDPEQYEVTIDTSISLYDGVDAQYAIANQQKLLAMMQIGDVSTLVADTENFEKYAQFEFLYDLQSLLSEEELAKYNSYLYYTDAASIENDDSTASPNGNEQKDPAELTINHRDPSTMEQPVAVGIILTEDNKLADVGYYAYLSDMDMNYQGFPSEAVLGIPITNKEPETAIRFLEYIFE